MGSGYGDGGLVVGHELAQEIGSGHHGDALFHSGFIFGIVRMDGCGVDHEIRTVLNVVCALTVINRGAAAGQKVGQGGLFGIRTGYGEMGCQQDLCQAAHADSADADEMDMNGLLEIYLIHSENLLLYFVAEKNPHTLSYYILFYGKWEVFLRRLL